MTTTALSTETRLERLEKEIREAEYEAFFYIGQRLLEIRQKRLYEQANFKSWSAYCAAGRLAFKKSQADTYIQASELRPKLPAIAGNQDGWGVNQLKELAKCETDNDAKRVAKKVIGIAKKTGERVTAKLIAQIRDGETTKADKELDAARLEIHLDKLRTILVKWRISLESIGLEQWEDVPRDVMIGVITETERLLTFLRS